MGRMYHDPETARATYQLKAKSCANIPASSEPSASSGGAASPRVLQRVLRAASCDA